MALNEIKKQVLLVLQSILTLSRTEQLEVMGFLQVSCKNFGLTMPKNVSETNELNKNCSELEADKTGANKLISAEKENEVNQDSTCNEQISLNDFTESIQFEEDNMKVAKSEEKKENRDVHSKKLRKKELAKKTGKKTAEKWKTKGKEGATKIDVEESVGKKSEVQLDESMALTENPKDVCDVMLPEVEEKKDIDVYKCPSCYVVFESRASLLAHLKSYSESSMSCRYCRKDFPGALEFWQHQKNGKCKMEELKCTDCKEKFKHRRHYLKHILGHKDNNCRYCEEKFSTWAQYKVHLKEKHPNIKMERDLIPCKFCPMSFHRHIGLYNHYRVKHSKGKFVCLSCGLLLPTKEKHREHALVHESEKNWKCKICKMKFYRRQQLLLHVSIHKLGIYQCLTCEITVTSKADLYKHKKDGHNVKGLERKFECEICHKTFAKRFTLSNHLATHSKEKCYTCKYCVKSFRTLDSLNRHQKRKSHFEKAKIVVPESKYEKVYEDKLICERCGKQYKTQRELKCHLIVHKNVYDCDECGKTFTLKFNLTKHLRLHRNPVGVVCELCGDTFNQMSALNEHCLMKHSDVRKVKCEICEKAFKRKSELNRHLRTHEFKRPFACFCGKAYKQSAHLQNHYKTAHGNTKQGGNLVEGAIQDFGCNQSTEMFRTNANQGEKRKKEYEEESAGQQGSLVPLENMPPENVFRPSNSYMGMQMNESKEPYVPNYGMRYAPNEMEQINVNYEDLNFPPDKRNGMVFSSPAVDLSMVAIPEVVENGMEMGESHRDVEETVEPFNKISDDTSQIQLLNLSEHIVQEYLLNLQ